VLRSLESDLLPPCPAAGASAGAHGEPAGPLRRGDGGEDEGDVGGHVRRHLRLEDLRLHQEEAGRRGGPRPRHVLPR